MRFSPLSRPLSYHGARGDVWSGPAGFLAVFPGKPCDFLTAGAKRAKARAAACRKRRSLSLPKGERVWERTIRALSHLQYSRFFCAQRRKNGGFRLSKRLFRQSEGSRFLCCPIRKHEIRYSLIKGLPPFPQTAPCSPLRAAGFPHHGTPCNSGTDFPLHSAKPRPARFFPDCRRFSGVRPWFRQG